MIDRAYMSAHVGRQQREREIRTTTAPIRSNGLTLAQKLEGIGAVAFLAIPFAAYCFGTTGAVVAALLLIAGAVTEWVRDWRDR